jgi:hypothetical protein
MSKRFPIPEFDRDQYKNLDWSQPQLLSKEQQEKLIASAKKGDAAAYGCYPVRADPAFFDRFKLTGPHQHAVMCLMPPEGAHVVGRSWAWPIQRALVVDSLDPASSSVLHEWATPRPMNTRLGPDQGVDLPGGVAYVVFGHKYGEHWIVNRTLRDRKGPPHAKGYSVLSATEDDAHDFHACNLSFSWA